VRKPRSKESAGDSRVFRGIRVLAVCRLLARRWHGCRNASIVNLFRSKRLRCNPSRYSRISLSAKNSRPPSSLLSLFCGRLRIEGRTANPVSPCGVSPQIGIMPRQARRRHPSLRDRDYWASQQPWPWSILHSAPEPSRPESRLGDQRRRCRQRTGAPGGRSN
jgi:hypothetical protein